MRYFVLVAAMLTGCAHAQMSTTPAKPALPSVAVVGPMNFRVCTMHRDWRHGGDHALARELHCGLEDMFDRFRLEDEDRADVIVHVDYAHPLQLEVGGPLDLTVRIEDRHTGQTIIKLTGHAELTPGRVDLTVRALLANIWRTLVAELRRPDQRGS